MLDLLTQRWMQAVACRNVHLGSKPIFQKLFQPSEIEQGKSFGWLILDEEIYAMSILMVICASASAGDHDWCSQDCVKMCAHTHVRFTFEECKKVRMCGDYPAAPVGLYPTKPIRSPYAKRV
jgi:hypothetical protein